MRIEINAGGLNSFFDGVSRFTSSGVSNSAQLIKSLQAVRNRATSLPLGSGRLGLALTHIDNRIRNEEHRVASVARVMQKAAQFRETAIDTDNRVAAMVNNEWEKFYHENPWLRPAPPPGFLERIGRGIVRFLEGFTLNVFSNAQHLLDWYARNSLFLNAFGSAGLFGLPGFAAISGDPVNMSTGNFLYNKEDIEISGRFPLVFNRFYNSKAGIESTLGTGWTHNYFIRLYGDIDSPYITFEDGHIEAYKNIDGKYISSAESRNTLTKTETGWKLVTQAMESYLFNEEGLLQRISDLNENTTDLTYENELLTKISNSCGHFEFTYNALNYISDITDHTGRVVKFKYENKHLTNVTHSNGAEFGYVYDKKGLLLELINPLGISNLKNEYDKGSRMIKQDFVDGGTMEYSYDDKARVTTFTQQNGAEIAYKRDEKFRTTEIRYEDGAEKFEYDDRNNRTAYVDKNKNIWKYEYDLGNNITKETNPLGDSTEIEYNEFNEPVKVTNPLGASIIFEYDQKGNVTKLIDPIERTTELVNNEQGLVVKATLPDKSDNQIEYDERGNIIGITDASGIKTQYEYDNLNRVVKTINGEGEQTSFEYNIKGDISKVTNAQNNSRTYEYNLTGKVTRVKDFDGGVIEYKYNDLGKVEQITDQADGVTSFTYDSMWDVASVTDPCGNTIKYEYDKYQKIIRTIDEEGNVTNYEYDPNGNITAVKAANGAETKIKYDALNRQEEIVEAGGAVTKLEYDKAGNVTKVTDALGNETKRAYDLAGQLTELTDPLGNKTKFEYSPLGEIKQVTNAKGESQVFEYYPGGRLKSVTLPCGESESYEYDKNGNVAKVSDALNNETKLIYDSLDRVTEIINPLGYSKKFDYDAVGNITSITDELGNITQYRYTLLGDVIEVIDAMGHSTKYDYDKAGRLTKFEQYRLIDDTLAKTKQTEYQVTTYERNKKGEVIAVTSPLGSVVKYGYDKIGNVISKLDEDNLETLYEYNIANQLTKVSYADGKTVELSYNALKQLTEAKDWLGTTTIEVDELGRATKVTDYEGKEVGYSWSELNQKEKLIYPDGSEVKYEYNASGRLSKVNAASGITSYAYDQTGRLTERILPDNTITKYEANPLGRLASLTHSIGNEILDSFKYSYDPVGNITQIDKYRANMEQDRGLFQYNYDPLGRLIEATNGNNTKLYNYDNLGNRISSIQNGVETRHSYNSRNQLIRTEGIDATNEYSYDLRGNLTQITENGRLKQSFTFDATDMMVGAFTANKGNAEYTYNGFRNRVKKLENLQIANEAMPDPTRELRYTLDMTLPYDNLLMTQGTENQSFVWGNTLLEASGSHFYLQDHLGSPIRLLGTDENNNTALAYDEFGVPLVGVNSATNSSSANQPFGFTGYQTDDISGLYYAQARYYTAEVGRFCAEDTIRDGLNWYGYCNGNPVGFVDPLGLECRQINWGKPIIQEKTVKTLMRTIAFLKLEPRLGELQQQLQAVWADNHRTRNHFENYASTLACVFRLFMAIQNSTIEHNGHRYVYPVVGGSFIAHWGHGGRDAVDFVYGHGAIVVAPTSGTIRSVVNSSNGRATVSFFGDDGYIHFLTHLQPNSPSGFGLDATSRHYQQHGEGPRIEVGQIIGVIGEAGLNHVHWSVTPTNPAHRNPYRAEVDRHRGSFISDLKPYLNWVEFN